MGKTKIKPIEDATVENKKTSKGKPKSEDVAKASNERVKVDAESPLSEAGEIGSETTSSDVDEPNRAGSEQSEEAELETQDTPSEQSQTTKSKPKKSKKQGKARARGKKYQAAMAQVDRSQKYPLTEAIELLQKTSYSSFTGTVEAHINTHQTNLRGFISLPFASGKKLTILAFGKDAKAAGADIEGDDKSLEEISKGKINFDVVVATPEWMGKLATVAKVLGPRGLMPNPKSGTITDDLKKIIGELQSGKTEYKTESKARVIHLSIGKVNQKVDQLEANVKMLFTTIGKSRISKLTLSPTMGPGVKVDLSSI